MVTASPTATSRVPATREAWQRVAEHLMAPELHRHTGRVGLRPSFRGVGTPEFERDGERFRLRLEGRHLIALADSTETWVPLTTLGEVAERLSLPLDPIEGVYEPLTSDDPDSPLAVDDEAAEVLGEWIGLVDAALNEFRTRHRDADPTIAQLWPEHFDLAISMSEINFGGALGDHVDGGRPRPYAYVGPWIMREGDFWTESYGAALDAADVTSPADLMAFFEAGLVAATSDGSTA